MSVKIGVLIAGSLYWNTRPHRTSWRSKYLVENSDIPVRVPIRYGRRSRTGSYTMVFAPGCPSGLAKVLICQNAANDENDVLREAQALWLAESPDGSPRRATETHSSDWGCVALLANPKSSFRPGFFAAWAGLVAKEHYYKTPTIPSYNSHDYLVKGRSAITNDGLLNIDWPVRADTGEPLDSIDLLLATATKPTPDSSGDYPDAKSVAGKWLNTKDHTYFRGNRSHGFHTFQDDEIERYLAAPGFMSRICKVLKNVFTASRSRSKS